MNRDDRHLNRRRWTIITLTWFLWVLLVLVCLPTLVKINAQGTSKQQREAQKAIRLGDYDKAEKIYRELLAGEQGDPQARLELSYTLVKKGRLDEAYQQATVVAGQDPLNARAHALLGVVWLRSGVFHQSIQELTTAALLDRRDSIALAALAEIDFFENRVSDSYDKLRQATNIDPYEPDYWIAFGRTAARLERFKEAAEHYERFLGVSPKLEEEKRDRYRGLIDFYYALARSSVTDLHRVDGPKSVTILFELPNARPYVKVKLNGSEQPLMFVVDTGASITVLSQQAAERLSVRPMARGGRARAVGGGGTFPIVYGLVNQIELGDMKVYNVPIYIRELHHFYQQGDNRTVVDGFLGLSVLTNFRVTLDYARREMILEQPSVSTFLEDLPAEVSVVPFRTTNGGLISAEARLGSEETFNFLVDSAATTTVLSGDVIQKKKWHDKLLPDLKVRVLGAAGVIEEVDLMLIPSFTLHNLEQRNIRAPVLDMNAINETAGFLQAGIIGGSFLRHFRITFDFQRFRLLLLPQTEAVRKIVPESGAQPQEKQSED